MRSNEQFIRSFKDNYNDPLPPARILMEVVSFGSLSKLYHNLKPSKQKREIANHFGVSDKVIISWLHSIVYLRNVCAHHSRLWNRNMTIQRLDILMPWKPRIDTANISKNRTYYMLCIFNYFLQTINPASQFKQKLKTLLSEISASGHQGYEFSGRLGGSAVVGRVRRDLITCVLLRVPRLYVS